MDGRLEACPTTKIVAAFVKMLNQPMTDYPWIQISVDDAKGVEQRNSMNVACRRQSQTSAMIRPPLALFLPTA